MGYETGEFQDLVLGTLHVEASSGMVIVQNADEMNPPLRLDPREALKLIRALQLACGYYAME